MEPAVLQRWLDEERRRDEAGCLPLRPPTPRPDGGGGADVEAVAEVGSEGAVADPASVVTSEDIRESVFPLEVRALVGST